jgi:hypothetical protein
MQAFDQGLRELGYVDGTNCIIERRYTDADGNIDDKRLAIQAEELVASDRMFWSSQSRKPLSPPGTQRRRFLSSWQTSPIQLEMASSQPRTPWREPDGTVPS